MDKNGNIVSDPIMGSNDLEGWKAAVEEQMKELQTNQQLPQQRNRSIYEKTDTIKRNRTCTGSGGRPDDGIWNIPLRNDGVSDKSRKYLHGVYWNWIKTQR